MQVYRSLEERFARISLIEDAIGILITSDRPLVAATGRPLTAEVFRTHLRERYLGF